MYCNRCGALNLEGSDICGSCGARLSTVDPASLPGYATSQGTRKIHAMGVGDILDETIRLFRQNFRTFIGIVAVLQLPLAILQMVQWAIVGPMLTGPLVASESQQGALAFWGLSNIAFTLLGGLASIVIEAALASAISQRYLGGQSTVGGAYRMALACFWRTLGATLLIGFFLLLMVVTIVGIPFAVILGIRWSLVIQAIVLDGKGVGQALSRSSSLVKGSWWRVLGILVVAIIAQYLVAAVPGGIIEAALGVVIILFPQDALFTVSIISAVVGVVFGILAAPLMPIVSTLLYYDLRVRKEGFDLQLLAERLGQGELPAAKGQL